MRSRVRRLLVSALLLSVGLVAGLATVSTAQIPTALVRSAYPEILANGETATVVAVNTGVAPQAANAFIKSPGDFMVSGVTDVAILEVLELVSYTCAEVT